MTILLGYNYSICIKPFTSGNRWAFWTFASLCNNWVSFKFIYFFNNFILRYDRWKYLIILGLITIVSNKFPDANWSIIWPREESLVIKWTFLYNFYCLGVFSFTLTESLGTEILIFVIIILHLEYHFCVVLCFPFWIIVNMHTSVFHSDNYELLNGCPIFLRERHEFSTCYTPIGLDKMLNWNLISFIHTNNFQLTIKDTWPIHWIST